MATEENNEQQIITVGDRQYNSSEFSPRAQELFLDLQRGTQARTMVDSVAKMSAEGWQRQFDDFVKLLPDPIDKDGAGELVEPEPKDGIEH